MGGNRLTFWSVLAHSERCPSAFSEDDRSGLLCPVRGGSTMTKTMVSTSSYMCMVVDN